MTSKAALRKKILACVRALTPEQRLERSARALEILRASDAYRAAKTVMAYSAFGAEFPTATLLRTCLDDGKTLGLPRADATDVSLSVHAIVDLDADLERHALGFQQPPASAPVIPLERLDLILAPGVAFDERGNRLGRGGGYYDRFLARAGLHAIICGLAFECQLVDSILPDIHDRPMDLILTENRLLRVRKAV